MTLEIAGRTWVIEAASEPDELVEQVRTEDDLQAFPYGLLLWPAAVALAERLADEPTLVWGRRVLELGAGVGLPGLVARALGAVVTQTDYQEAPLELARRNAMRHGIEGISYLAGDWRCFPALPPFDAVIGSDILFERGLHPVLRDLLPTVLAPGGTLLLADPLRPQAVLFMDGMERDGWQVEMDAKTIAWREERREIALFTARRG